MESGQKSLAQLALEQKTPKYVTLEVGSKISGYTPDFLDRLCRLKKVKYRLWNGDKHVIELESLLNETHSIIPSFEGLDLIDESDTTPDTSVAAAPLPPPIEKAAEAPVSAPSANADAIAPPPPSVEESAPSAPRPQDTAAPVSIPIESKPAGMIVTESRPIGVERAKAMLGYAAASSRKRVGESRIGEFSFVGRSVVSDPDHPENSADAPDVRIPIPIMAAEMEAKKRAAEQGGSRPAAPQPLPEPATPLPAPEPWVPPVPPPQAEAPSVVVAAVPEPVQPASANVPVGDDWDALLLGGQPSAEVVQAAVVPDVAIAEPAALSVAAPEPAMPPVESSHPVPAVEAPVPDISLASTPLPVQVSPNTYAEALPPRADLGDILSAMMPPGVIVEEEGAYVAQPDVVTASSPLPIAVETEIAESDKPLFPPLSRPTPLSVEPLEMFPKTAIIEPTPPTPPRPPFPELTPISGNTLGTQAPLPQQPRPFATPPVAPGPSPLDDHMLARDPVFNAVAALVLLLAALGLALAQGHIPGAAEQAASVGTVFSPGEDPSSAEPRDRDAAIRDAFSDDIIVTPGTTEDSVVITPIFQSGPGNSFEYILMPAQE